MVAYTEKFYVGKGGLCNLAENRNYERPIGSFYGVVPI